MSKTIIEVKCTDQVLAMTNTPVIASGGVGEDFVSIDFCSMWDDYTPSLLFWRKGVNPIPVLADADGLYQVPAALTGEDGIIYFGAVGYDANGTRRTSKAISYRLEAGAITEGTELPAPSGDVFDQLMTFYADVKFYVAANIEGVATSAAKAEAAAIQAQATAASVEASLDGIVSRPTSVGFDSKKIGSASAGYRLQVNVMKEPVDGTVLRFKAAAASEDIVGLLVATYATGDGKNFSLVDADRRSACNGVHSFGANAWVTVLLDSTEEKAYILNAVPEMPEIPEIPESLEADDVYFSGYYTGNGTSNRTINLGASPCILVIQGKDSSKNYIKDFMMLVNPDSLGDMNISTGFEIFDMNTSQQDHSGAQATLSGSFVTLDGGNGPEGFNMSGRTYYYWGMSRTW